jgi:hypothetical protein
MIGTMCGPTSLVRPPRIVFTWHARGQNLGEPNEPVTQRQILIAALALFYAATEPFTQATWPKE